MFAHSIRRHPNSCSCGLVTSIILLLFAVAGNAFAHGVTFKFQHAQAADSALSTQFLDPWAKKIHDDSRGRVSLLITPQDQHATGTELFQVVLERTADIVWLDLQQPAVSFPIFGVFGLPLAGTTAEGSSRALWTWTDINDLGFREFKELRVLAAARHDTPVFHMREKAVSSLSDLKGARIAIPTADAETFLTGLGASPVVISGIAMRDALAQSSVDGALLSWSGLAALELEELVKAHSSAPVGAPWAYAELSVLLMNPDAYRSLADDLKQVVRNYSGSDVSAWIGKSIDETASDARKRAADRGDSFTTLPESDLDKWREAASVAINKRVADLDARGLHGEELITRARALIEQYDTAN